MTAPTTTCAYHPDRRAGVSCQRCGRPICPDCMITASVGFQCPECARQGRQQVYTRHTIAQQRDPIVTKALIGINVVVYLLTGIVGGDAGRSGGELFARGGLTAIGPSWDGRELAGVDVGEWYRLVTSGFLHANVIHIGFNMYLLWLLGSMLEPALGRVRFGLLYGVSLLGGSFGVMLLDPRAFTVGASGAVFGLMGATIVAQRASGIDPWQSGIGALVLINLMFTFAISSISIGGHVGGLIGGLTVGALLIEVPRRLPITDRRLAHLAAGALVVLLGIGLVVGSIWAAGQWRDPLLG